MTKRVVSKRTKLLFIGFGAVSIATASIVAAVDRSLEEAARTQPTAVRPALSAHPGK